MYFSMAVQSWANYFIFLSLSLLNYEIGMKLPLIPPLIFRQKHECISLLIGIQNKGYLNANDGHDDEDS